MERVLITGASGFLGTKLYEMYKPHTEILGTYFGHKREDLVALDVTNEAQTRKLIKDFHPDIVIHTVALSDPDVCEQRKEDAERINHIGTKNIVECCRSVGARLDYISTVYVFDGEKGYYSETDTPNPINWYGETKLKAEQEVFTLPNFGIYRFDKLYGYNGQNKPNDAISKILAGKPFEVNSDQVRQPLLIDDIFYALRLVQQQKLNGIYHLAGPDNLSKYKLTVELAKLFGKEELVIPIAEKNQLARRPKDASILTTKAQALGIKFTPLKEALRLIQDQL